MILTRKSALFSSIMSMIPFARLLPLSASRRFLHQHSRLCALATGDNGTISRPKRSKVAVVGVGAVGSYYGARLWEAGHDVQFQMRGVNYRTAIEKGIRVSSIDGDIHIPPSSLNAFEDTSEMDKADWVIVALKSTSLSDVPSLVLPLLRSDSRLLLVMNGLVEEDVIALLREYTGQTVDGPLACCMTVYGGMAFICCNRMSPATTNHTFYGPLSAGVTPSTREGTREAKEAFVSLWEGAKVKTSFVPSLLRERWRKNLWNLPFNGLSVSMGGITVDKIVGDPGLRRLAEEIMEETLLIANKNLEDTLGKGRYIPLTEEDSKLMMTLSDTMGPYRPSTMIDLVEKRPMEVEYLFRKPLERAQQLGLQVPYLESIVLQAEAHQRLNGLF